MWHDTTTLAGRRLRLIVLMLPDLPEVEAVLDGPDGSWPRPRATCPGHLLHLVPGRGARPAAAAGRETAGAVRVVDAPVSGGTDGAEAGTLSIMVGGADADVARALAVLRACGTPVHLGPLGAGQVAKACNQMIVAATVLALGEAAVLPTAADWTCRSCSISSPAGTPAAESWRPAGSASSPRTTAVRGQVHGQGPGFAADVADATGTHAVLLPAVKAASTNW